MRQVDCLIMSMAANETAFSCIYVHANFNGEHYVRVSQMERCSDLRRDSIMVGRPNTLHAWHVFRHSSAMEVSPPCCCGAALRLADKEWACMSMLVLVSSRLIS